MNYKVIVQPPAQRDIEAAYTYIRSFSEMYSKRWLNGLENAIASLSRFPNRCSKAPEGSAFDEEIYQLLYGRRNGRYRILFIIRGREVRILHVRHGARLPLSIDEFESDHG